MPAPVDPSDRPGEPNELAPLARGIEPPAELERRTLAELRRRGLVAPTPAVGPVSERVSRRALALAAAVTLVAFALGLWLGPRIERSRAAVETVSDRYLLLLYEPRPIERAGLDLVAEYSAWAGELAQRGLLVEAEKLASADLRLGSARGIDASLGSSGPTGFFLIRAASASEAEAIARSCPHLKHGGEVSLRPVDPT